MRQKVVGGLLLFLLLCSGLFGCAGRQQPVSVSSVADNADVKKEKAEAKDFLGRLEGRWNFREVSGAYIFNGGGQFHWNTSIDVSMVDSKIRVVYWEDECSRFRLDRKLYPPQEGTVTADGKLSFPFFSPSGREFTILVEKLSDGSFKAKGRVWGGYGLYTEASLRKVN
ncbi:MAG TPA: hypothetical protein VK254_02810 [Candidatus Bathyarchaeia archaeon]|nr:hypothetical protein [Candidatus Bathyarchaeia archaeon]